ncbi:MAG: GntR family transcriptional regulator [Nocardioides sp.]|uniref:GntR family transcriptional regulator n=1 Tax=Nocardioides sp. TaxID=35761 RepID=UPI0039E47EB2
MSTVDVQSFNRARNETRRRLQRSPHRVHDLLRSGIRTGLLAGNGALIEDALVASLAASRNSVRQALQLLAAEGLVLRRPNLGTTVVGSISEVPLHEIVSRSQLGATSVTVREVDQREIPSTDYLRARLETDAETVEVDEVLVCADGEPRSVRVSYVPWEGAPCPRVRDVIPVPQAFKKVFGVALGECEVSISAVACGASLSGMLGIVEGAPVLVEEVVLRDVNGQPREFSYTHHRADRVALSINLPVAGPQSGLDDLGVEERIAS